MVIYLIPNATREQAAPVTLAAARLLLQDGHTLYADPTAAPLFNGVEGVQYLSRSAACEGCDMIVTIGGDGTILHAARHTIPYGKPVLGINTGHLGFLTVIEANELFKLHRLAEGAYRVEERSLIEVQCGNGHGYKSLALNDIVLFKQRPESTIMLDIYCDDVLVSSFRGDGVVFSTPTGSTAYSLSAGGPIVDTRLGGIVVTQICAHILQTPPMVLAADRKLRVQPREGCEGDIAIICDGLPGVTAPAEGGISIATSDKTVPLVQMEDADQLRSIDKKLKGR